MQYFILDTRLQRGNEVVETLGKERRILFILLMILVDTPLQKNHCEKIAGRKDTCTNLWKSAGVVLVQSLQITDFFQYGVRMASETENYFTSVERIQAPLSLPFLLSSVLNTNKRLHHIF
jgi:hypothetical protein